MRKKQAAKAPKGPRRQTMAMRVNELTEMVDTLWAKVDALEHEGATAMLRQILERLPAPATAAPAEAAAEGT